MKCHSKLIAHTICAEIKIQFHVSLHSLIKIMTRNIFFVLSDQTCTNNRILHQISCVDALSQNGIVEKNRDLFEIARALLFQSH